MIINPNESATSIQKLWNMLKIVVSCIMRFLFFISSSSSLVGSLKSVKSEVGFLVLLLTSLYCCYKKPRKQGKTGGKGYRSSLRLIHFEAFALVSLSLSSQTQSRFMLCASNFLLTCLVLAIMEMNFLVGVGLAVLCYIAMNSHSYSDSGRREQCRHGGGEPDGAVVVHPSSLSTPSGRWSVSLELSSPSRAGQKLVMIGHEPCRNLELLVFLKTPSQIVIRHISFKTLKYVSLPATEYSTLLIWDFTKELRNVRLLNFWLPESRALAASNALRLLQLMGPDDHLFNFIPNYYYY